MTECKCSACRCGDKMFTIDDYFMGRDVDARFAALVTPELRKNAERWVSVANSLILQFYLDVKTEPRKIRSGWRPPEINAATKGSAPNSLHMTGHAGDIEDTDRALANWCVGNREALEAGGVWMEDPRATPSWVHWQDVPPKSGKRFFIPDANWAARLAGKPLTEESLHG